MICSPSTWRDGAQAERSAATREALVRATLAILVERGWAGVTQVSVCARAGLTRGAFVHHFDGLPELFARRSSIATRPPRRPNGGPGRPVVILNAGSDVGRCFECGAGTRGPPANRTTGTAPVSAPFCRPGGSGRTAPRRRGNTPRSRTADIQDEGVCLISPPPRLASWTFAAVLACGAAWPARGETPEPAGPASAPAPVLAPTTPDPGSETPAPAVSAEDRAFLDRWQQRCFRFFWEQADPATGLVADRAPADGSQRVWQQDEAVGSIASVGFGLTAICIADERGWVEQDAARERVALTLRFLLNQAQHHEGFFYHFVNMKTGQRAWNSELSSIDTALLLAGVLTARQYYRGTEVEDLATKLYDRVNWPWMMGDGRTLSMGWTPEKGFITFRWDHFSEHLVLQALGLGSNTHPLPRETWHSWKRGPVYEHEGNRFMSYPPLFVHQFSHAWIDFRHKRDDYADYWTNSVFATHAHRAMFKGLAERFPLYGEMLWGLTSSDSATGYTAWGGPDPSPHIDGTIVPCAAAGSIPFAPAQCVAAVRHMMDAYGESLWKHYGLADAFNPHTGWVANDVIGIDVGITMLMIENQRSGFVWRYFMANPEVNRAMLAAGFRPLAAPGPGESAVALFFDGDGPNYVYAPDAGEAGPPAAE